MGYQSWKKSQLRKTKALTVKKSETHSCCVASYYDPLSSKDEIVRMTAIVVDLSTDKEVDRLEFDGNALNESDITSDAVIDLASKWNATLYPLTEPVPLEKCPCNNCIGYMDNVIRSSDVRKYKSSH